MQLQLHLNMAFFLKRLILPVALLGFALASVIAFNLLLNRPSMLAQQSVLALDVWLPEHQEKVSLAGEWAFFWDEFVQADALESRLLANNFYVDFPGVWTGLQWQGQNIPAQGRATVALRLKLPEEGGRYTLKIPALTANYRLWVNGEAKIKNDALDDKIQQATGKKQSRLIDFKAQNINGSQEALLMFHLSNYHSKTGGIWESLYITRAEQRGALRSFNVTRDVVTSFALCVCAVVLAWLAWRKQRLAYVFLACWAALMAVRAGTIEERLFFEMFVIQDWEAQRKWEYGILYAMFPFFALYLGHRFPRYFPAQLHWVTSAVLGSLILLILVTPAVVYSQTIWIFQGTVLLYALLWFGALVEFTYKEPKHGSALLLGSLVFVATAVNDILYTNNIINGINLSQIGALFFLACGYFLYRVEEKEAAEVSANTPIVSVWPEVDSAERPNAVLMTEADRRELIASAMNFALKAWLSLGKTKIELAEESGLWRITNDDGTLKTRTLNKYLRSTALPKNPRVGTVVKTLEFVKQSVGLDESQVTELEQAVRRLSA